MCAKLPTGRLQIVPSEKFNLPQKKITCNIYIYTSNLVTVHLPCVLFLSWPITRPHFSGKKFHKNSEDHEIMLKEIGVGSETSQISMDFYKGFIVLYHSSTILLVTSTSFCLFNKFRDFLNLSIKSTVFKICNNQHTQGITLYIGSLKTTSLSCIHKKKQVGTRMENFHLEVVVSCS